MTYRQKGKRVKLVKYAAVSPIFLLSCFAFSFDFITDNELSFGLLAIPKNNNISSVIVTRSGRTSSTGSIFILEPGTPGEHTITGLAPYTYVNLSVSTPVEPIDTYSGPTLRITAIEMQSAGNANANGELSFFMGATLSTSGDGNAYLSGATYNFRIPIEITF